jgi:catechol 2,3-dioxygenase-like lactoylglutathione lyase family enzyme
VLHHVSLEVHPDHVGRTIELFELLGFERVPAPEPIAPYVSWVERDGTQIHLIQTPYPATPALGHAGVVAPDFEAAIERLRAAGFEVEDTRELWGARPALSRSCREAAASS